MMHLVWRRKSFINLSLRLELIGGVAISSTGWIKNLVYSLAMNKSLSAQWIDVTYSGISTDEWNIMAEDISGWTLSSSFRIACVFVPTLRLPSLGSQAWLTFWTIPSLSRAWKIAFNHSEASKRFACSSISECTMLISRSINSSSNFFLWISAIKSCQNSVIPSGRLASSTRFDEDSLLERNIPIISRSGKKASLSSIVFITILSMFPSHAYLDIAYSFLNSISCASRRS